MSLLRLTNAQLAFGHVPLLDGVDLQLERGERVALVGRNGTGKSSLLKILAGIQPIEGGELRLESGTRVSYLPQELPDPVATPIFEVVSEGLGELGALLAEYFRLSATAPGDGTPEMRRLGALQAQIETRDGWNVAPKVDAVLSRMDLPGDKLLSECSGGIRRRVMMARALVSDPDLLLLDEPTNHLDIEAIEALEALLLGFPGALMLVSHDRTLVDRVATRIVELDRGVLTSFPGNHATYLERKAQMLDAQAGANARFDKELAQEEVWIRQGIKARRTRNEGRVRRLEAMRRERAERRERQGQVRLDLSRGEQSGALVVELENVSFGYTEPVVKDFSTRIMRGDRIGIIGPNGCGKSTLLRLLLGELAPQSGRVTLGTRLNVAYFDQQRAQLRLEETVRENVAEGSDQITIGGRTRHVVGYLGDFLFPPARINSPVKTLSGGERNRLLLARLFTRQANLLVLDEPTNDLDVETLELLEELLLDYDGTLLLVSHDRAFLDAVVTGVIAFEGAGRVREYVGGFSDWLRQRPVVQAAPVIAPSGPAPARADIRTDTPAGPPGPAEVRPVPRRKLGYQQERELAALPERIDRLETEQEALQQELASPGFYQGDRERIDAVVRDLARLESEIAEAYARWETLEQG